MSPKISSIALLAIVLAFCFGPAALANKGNGKQQGSSNGQPFQHLQSQIDELADSIGEFSASLQSQIDALVQSQAAQDELIGALTGAIAALEARVDQHGADLEALAALQHFQVQLVDQLADQYADLEQRISDHENEISTLVRADQTLQLLVFAIEAQVYTLQDRISVLEDQFGGLSDEIGILYGELAALHGQLAVFQQALRDKQHRVAQICPVGQAIRGINANGTVVCQPVLGGGGGRLDRFVIERSIGIPASTSSPRISGSAVACPTGYLLSGGGYFLSGNLGAGHVWRSFPVTTPMAQFWAATVKSEDAPSRSLTVYAICQRLTIQSA